MTRSERLAKEGKVEVCIGSFELATVINDCNETVDLRYMGTDYECIYDGYKVWADIYEDYEGSLYAVIQKNVF